MFGDLLLPTELRYDEADDMMPSIVIEIESREMHARTSPSSEMRSSIIVTI